MIRSRIPINNYSYDRFVCLISVLGESNGKLLANYFISPMSGRIIFRRLAFNVGYCILNGYGSYNRTPFAESDKKRISAVSSECIWGNDRNARNQ